MVLQFMYPTQYNTTKLSLDILFKEYLRMSVDPLLKNDSLRIGCIYRSPTADLTTSTISLYDLLSAAAT